MRLRHTIYNSIGLVLAALFSLAILFNILKMVRINGVPGHHPFGYFWALVTQMAVVCFAGGGAVANMAAGRLKPKPTIAMIIAYCLTCVLLPMGIWGIIELRMIRDRRRAVRETYSKTESRNHSSFTPKFLRRAAVISWAGVVVGFVIIVFCGASHVRPLINVAIVIFFFTLILSFVLGLVALLGVKEHGKKGILIPALIGICISGFFILMGCIALTIGLFEGAAELRQKHENMIHNSSLDQTNAVSNSQ
jgi:hypothetical protein